MSKSTFPIIDVKENKLISINGNTSSFYKINNPDLEQMTHNEKESFFDSVSSGLNYLETDKYFKFYKLGDESFLDTNSQVLPDLSSIDFLEQKVPLETFFGESLMYSNIGIYDDYVSYCGNYIRLFSVLEFSDSEAYPFFLPSDIDYVITVKRKAKDKSVSKLDRIRSGHLSSFLKPKRDITSEGAYSQAEELLTDIIHGHEELFDIEMIFMLKTNSLEELNRQSQAFTIQMNAIGIKTFSEGQSLVRAKSGLASIFNELIPGVKPTSSLRVIPNKTSHLRYLLPLHESKLMNKGIRFHDANSSEIFFNPFIHDIKNRNMLVTGLSGGGKSVFVNKLVHHLIDDHPTVILDKGGSFKKVTEYHIGSYLKKGFNPFQFKDPIYLREIILSIVDEDSFNKLERGRLLRAIKDNVDQCKCFNDLVIILKDYFKDIDLYFEEFKDYFTDEEMDFQSILYVDIEDYPKGIVTPLIIFILEYFKRIPANEKILVFDECWSFLKDHTSFIDECFRAFRKTGAFPIAISQSLRDFSHLNSDLASSITNNSYFKIFFPQELEVANDIAFFDIANINTLEFKKGIFSECYLKTSDNRYRKTIRNYLSPLELQLFHTEAGTDLKFNQFLNQFKGYFNNHKEAVNAYVRLIHDETNHSFYFSNYSKDSERQHLVSP
ncbi:MAG: hypothetical protein K9K67_15620 [Bacteriovoracaceae bacterium]|nr:hypothetical protein [Bacteriovoracaceae bacterium]